MKYVTESCLSFSLHLPTDEEKSSLVLIKY